MASKINNISLISIALIFLSLYSCQLVGAQDLNIKIATDKLIGGLPLFVTLNQTLLDKQGITYSADFFATSSKVAQAMVSGQYGVGGPVALIDLIILESKDPGKFKVFTIMTENHSKPTSNILIKKDSPYNSLTDLNGKTLGIGPGAVFEFLTNVFLQKFNLKDVKLVIVPPGSWIPSLETGKVDAIFSVEPFTTISLNNNVSKILYPGPQSAAIDPMPVVALAFTTDFIKNNPDAVPKIVKAFDEGTEISKKSPELAKKTLVEYADLNSNIAQQVSLNGFYNSTQLNEMLPKLQELSDLMYKQGGYIDNPVNATNLIYKP